MMLENLYSFLQKYSKNGIVLAFSGGVDSTLLLAVLKKLSEKESFPFIAVMVHSTLQENEEVVEAQRIASLLGIVPIILKMDPLAIKQVKANSRERCYWCKREIFSQIQALAESHHLHTIIDGTNADDLQIFRPGRRALRELGIISPLAELGMTKKNIRELAQQFGLECASKPSRPCLATRFEYDVELTSDKLIQVEKGEQVLREILGEKIDFRLRVYHESARIEVPSDYFYKINLQRTDLVQSLKQLGFRYVTLDCEGFRSGSMDEVSV